MVQRSKAYRAAAEKIDRTRLYAPLEAVRLAKQTSVAKYDATIEVAHTGRTGARLEANSFFASPTR